MKKLKILLSVFLAIFFVIPVGCKNNEKIVYPTNTDETEASPSFLKIISDRTMELFNKTDYKEDSFLSNGGKKQYDTYINAGLEILNGIDTLNLDYNKVYTGKTLTNEDGTEITDNSAVKVRYLYFKYDKKGNTEEFTATIVFEKSKYNINPLNYILFNFDVTYSSATKSFESNLYIENSFSNANYVDENTNSHADYYWFYCDSKFMGTGIFFNRMSNFDYSDAENITSSTIKNYDYLMFDFSSMQDLITSNSELNIDNELNKGRIKSALEKFSELDNMYLSLAPAEVETDNLSNKATENLVLLTQLSIYS